MEEKHVSFAILGVIAIIAVVGLVLMFTGSGAEGMAVRDTGWKSASSAATEKSPYDTLYYCAKCQWYFYIEPEGNTDIITGGPISETLCSRDRAGLMTKINNYVSSRYGYGTGALARLPPGSPSCGQITTTNVPSSSAVML